MQPPRPYRNERDLERMIDLLVQGRAAKCGAYYVHPGDLRWWLYYPAEAFDWAESIYLWEGREGVLLGWVFFSLKYCTFDLFVQPALRGGCDHESMLDWTVAHLSGSILARGGRQICTMWVPEDDMVMASLLSGRGFSQAKDCMLLLQRSLSEPVPLPVVPEGYVVRSVAGEHEMERRATVSYGAFASAWPFDAYCRRYLAFMRSPVYVPEHDLVVATPEGRFASYCILWLDGFNRVGLFEPVGTHPECQRKGFGRAVLLEGLRHLRNRGMQIAIVGAEHDNDAARRLYQSVGFQVSNRMRTFAQDIG